MGINKLNNEITINSYLDVLQLNESYLQESNSFTKDKVDLAIKSYKKNIAVAEKVLKDNGVDISAIKSKAKSLAKSFSKEIKNGYKNKIPALKIAEIISKKVVIEIKKIVKNLKKTILKDIWNSVVILIGLLFLSTFIFSIVGIITVSLGIPKLGLIFAALIAGPFLEEYAKRISVLNNYPWVYTGIFAGFEFVKYLISGISVGFAIIPFVIMRLAVVAMHFTTTSIQKYFYENDIDFGPKGLNGYYIAVLIHFSWNLIMLIGDDFLRGIVT